MRQGYLSSFGNKKTLSEGFINSITAYIPLFRGIIVLFGKNPPLRQSEVITALSEAVDINTDVFIKILKAKHDKIKLSIDELNILFKDCYETTEKIGKIVDEIK